MLLSISLILEAEGVVLMSYEPYPGKSWGAVVREKGMREREERRR
jgi:hypothetical protein